ncbi:aldehyde-activating protein [Pseudoxanthomonas sangjuensis]|uniref:GFA family protein n=1 Tax=Pseudoxanthomonas sangjuensis TaxID=1503750 RepID=UPI0013910D71|nr:GFA family protein [Pseudoxanthomonas sangjuensis]KAF1708473.1 aldehyde-activating protein [Pseudoxanthomonas sangjuensis]
MQKTYRASCHCGTVVVEAGLDLAEGSFRCNCSICRRHRSWLAVVPPDRFRLRAGEGALTEYVFGAHNIHHCFCRHCGVKVFGRVDASPRGGLYAVNLGCLEDVGEEELSAVAFACIDGLNDRFDAQPEFYRHM